MWRKGSGEGVTDQGVRGPQGKRRDGVTMKGGGRVWVKNTDQRRKLEKGANYIQGTDVNTPRTWCSMMATWTCTSHKPKRVSWSRRTVIMWQFRSLCFEEWMEFKLPVSKFRKVNKTGVLFIFICYSVDIQLFPTLYFFFLLLFSLLRFLKSSNTAVWNSVTAPARS